MIARLLLAAPALLTAIYLARVLEAPSGAGVLALAVLIGAAVGPRLNLGIVGRTVLAALAIGAILVFARVLLPAEEETAALTLPRPYAAVAAFCLLSVAARLVTRDAAGGALATAGYCLIALGAAGQTRDSAPYGALCVAHVGLVLAALRAKDDDRPRLAALPNNLRLGAALLCAATTVGSVLLVLPLLPLSRYIQGRFEQAALGEITRVGFHEHLRLGSLRRVLQSDRPVLRLRGPKVDYLRGGVYDHAEGNYWSSPKLEAAQTLTVPRAPIDGPDVVYAELVGDGAGHDPFFLPLSARGLASETGVLRAVRFGVVQRDMTRLWWHAPAPEANEDAGPARGAAVDPPGPRDLELPRGSAAALRAIAADFIGDAPPTNPALRLARIEARLLRDYRYSLEFERRPQRDAVLEFLTNDKRGHCEYFAAALTLLARAAGVPARLVGGYRVGEHNPVGGFYLVRERNAHAWVEAHLPGRGWQTFDATPGGGPPENAPHEARLGVALWDSLGDAISRLKALVRAVLAQGPLRLGVPLTLVIIIGLLIRWLQTRAARRQAPSPGAALPGFLRLQSALSATGTPRPLHEPLETYAERLQQKDPESAALLLRYAALRYGDRFEPTAESALDQALSARAATLGG